MKNDPVSSSFSALLYDQLKEPSKPEPPKARTLGPGFGPGFGPGPEIGAGGFGTPPPLPAGGFGTSSPFPLSAGDPGVTGGYGTSSPFPLPPGVAGGYGTSPPLPPAGGPGVTGGYGTPPAPAPPAPAPAPAPAPPTNPPSAGSGTVPPAGGYGDIGPAIPPPGSPVTINQPTPLMGRADTLTFIPLANESDFVRFSFSASLYEKDLLTFELVSD